MRHIKSSTLVMGAGFLGFATSKFLEKSGIEVEWMRINGESFLSSLVFSRAFEQSTLNFFQDWLPSLKWEFIDDKPFEWTKGKWCEAAARDELSFIENFFLRHPYHVPVLSNEPLSYNGFMKELRVAWNEKEVHFKSQVKSFDRIYWCLPKQKLNEVLPTPLSDKTKSNQYYVGIEIEVGRLDIPKTSLFPFRFKEARLRALGIRGKDHWNWLIHLPDEIAEDSEEIAKVVKTLRRELNNAFPGLSTSRVRIVEEPITYEITDKKTGFEECFPSVFALPEFENQKKKERWFITADHIAQYCKNLEILTSTGETGERPGISIENILPSG